MKNDEDSQHRNQVKEIQTGGRGNQPYQKPARRRERVLETTALVCGKVQTTQSSCHSNRKTS